MPASSSEMKRGLEQIDRDLLDCHSVVALKRLRAGWIDTALRSQWNASFMNLAEEKFTNHDEMLRVYETALKLAGRD